ncbi:MAG: hypothetical protein WAO71_04450 [Gallionella sp.]
MTDLKATSMTTDGVCATLTKGSAENGNEVLQSSRVVRALYVTALLALVPSTLVGFSGWVSLVTGGGLGSIARIALYLVMLAMIFFRVYLVLRYPTALNGRIPNLAGKFLRAAGMFAMLIGGLAGIALFLVKPITLAIFKSAGSNGIGYFVVTFYLVFLANFGWLGCLCFELSRVFGAKFPRGEPRQTRRQDIAVFATLVTGAFALVSRHASNVG